MRIFFLAILLCGNVLFANNANASSCQPAMCKDKYMSHQLIFQGKVLRSEATPEKAIQAYKDIEKPERFKNDVLPDTYTEFEILTLYKGKAGKTVNVYYNTGPNPFYRNPEAYKVGDEVTIYANDKYGYFVTFRGPCSECREDGTSLEAIKASLDAINGLIEQNPSVMEYYSKKLSILEEYKDFEQASETYEKAITSVSNEDKKQQLILGYGRSLYETTQYDKAIEVLKPYASQPEAKTYIQLSLIKSGRSGELGKEGINLSEQTLENVTINDVDLSSSNFKNATLKKVIFKNVLLQNSNFIDAKLDIEFDNVDATGSIFDQSKIVGKAKQSIFDSGSFKNSELRFYEFYNNSFVKADLTNSILWFRDFGELNFSNAIFKEATIHSIGNSKLENTDFTGATFFAMNLPGNRGQNQNIDFSKQVLDNANFRGNDLTGSRFIGSSLKNTIYRGAILKDVDFSNADLTGADFSGSFSQQATDVSGANFSSANIENTVWTGVHYDCDTKFPEGFSPREYMLVSTDDRCETVKVIHNYSWEESLLPPYKHYRILPTGSLENFTDVNLSNSNFEGARSYLRDKTNNFQRGNIFSGSHRFTKVNLENANFKFNTGSIENFDSNLNNADFSYSNLSRLMIRGDASLEGTKFYCTVMNNFSVMEELDISKADFTAAIFSGLNFQKWNKDYYKFDPIKAKVLFRFMQQLIDEYGPADYSGMDFSKCDLMDINFGTTNLANAKFKGAHFYRTDFTNANLEGADFDGARYEKSAQFPANFDFSKHKIIPTAIINGNSSGWAASYRGLSSHHINLNAINTPNQRSAPYNPPNIQVPDFPNEDLSKTDYTASWLMGADMSGSNISFSNFQASNLVGVNFSNVEAKGAVFYDALLDNVNLDNANFEGADFRSATLKGAKLENANLKNAIYDGKTVWPEDFDPKKHGLYFVD